MKEILKQKGYKITPARTAIMEIFYESKIPVTAEDIYKKLQREKKYININEATVYRTLATLEKAEIVRRVDLRKDISFFELAENHHHHIVCVNCNDIEDFENTEIERVLGRIVETSSKFKNIKEHSLELFGLCKVCA